MEYALRILAGLLPSRMRPRVHLNVNAYERLRRNVLRRGTGTNQMIERQLSLAWARRWVSEVARRHLAIRQNRNVLRPEQPIISRDQGQTKNLRRRCQKVIRGIPVWKTDARSLHGYLVRYRSFSHRYRV